MRDKFAKINPRKKSTGSKFVKLNPRKKNFFSFFRISKTYVFTLGSLSVNDLSCQKHFAGYQTIVILLLILKSSDNVKKKCRSFYYICSFWYPPRHSIENWVIFILLVLFEIPKNAGKSFVTHILLAK